MLALKIEGYQTVYPYGVLPVDSYDFFATHHLVCREVKGRWDILMAYKSVTLARCQTHRLPFPGLSLLRNSGAETHAHTLEGLLKSHASHPELVTYGSSWTIHPEARKDLSLKNQLKEIMTAMLVRHEQDIGSVERISCGAPKIKTDQYFINLGYERLSRDGDLLPAFPQASLIGEMAVMLRCSQFSDYALSVSDNYNKLLDAQMTLGRPKTLSKTEAA